MEEEESSKAKDPNDTEQLRHRRHHHSSSFDDKQLDIINKGAEFHRLFEFSPNEKLVEDFSCAYDKTILRQGRLYITQNHVAFYSMVGIKLSIDFDDIIKIEKKKTMGLFNNAIQITTNPDICHYFTSFIFRDQAFKILNDLWNLYQRRNKAGKAAKAQQKEGTAEESETDDSRSIRTRSDYDSQEEEEWEEVDEEQEQEEGSASDQNENTKCTVSANIASHFASGERTEEAAQLSSPQFNPPQTEKAKDRAIEAPLDATPPPITEPMKANKRKDGKPTDADPAMDLLTMANKKPDKRKEQPTSEKLEGEVEEEGMRLKCIACESLEDAISKLPAEHTQSFCPLSELLKKPLRTDVNLPKGITLVQLFHMLFDDHSMFVRAYHEKRGDTGLTLTPWSFPTAPDGAGSGIRQMSCVTEVTKPKKGTTNLYQEQRFVYFSTPTSKGLQLHIASRTPEVVSGDTFRVEAVLLFCETDGAISLNVYGMLYFVKSTMMRRIIEAAAAGELGKSYDMYVDEILERVRPKSTIPRVGQGTTSRKRSHSKKHAVHRVKTTAAKSPQPPPKSVGASYLSLSLVLGLQLLLCWGMANQLTSLTSHYDLLQPYRHNLSTPLTALLNSTASVSASIRGFNWSAVEGDTTLRNLCGDTLQTTLASLLAFAAPASTPSIATPSLEEMLLRIADHQATANLLLAGILGLLAWGLLVVSGVAICFLRSSRMKHC
eukprot:NODE_435_length_2239_cov_33.409091_g405_i0.p1 GENE.NODE_435_length_2239_cov_33.409091_g405_i0~~NODE_435_length_2239_cov_33.409091_g405_i0.p1  ORF type:complete len:735 (-),score=196.63 NODE_435_length_2239_cov_33.409091_g405_i0:35-2188(-)